MKKMIFVLSFFLIIYTPHIVHAETPYNIIESIEEIEGVDAGEIAEEVLSGEVSLSFSSIAERVCSLFVSGIKENLTQIFKMTSLAVISGLILNIGGIKNETGIFGVVAVISLFSVRAFSRVLAVTEETIESLFIFVQSLMIPISTAVTTTGVASGGTAASVFVSMQVFIYICKTVFLPLICVITVFSAADKLGEIPYLQGINKLLKQILKWGTGLMITIYSVVVALKVETAVNFDTLAGKSLKYAVGSFMPVVGGALADSLETVITSARTVAGAIGIAGIIGVGYVCIVPLINVCCVSICFKIASAIATVSTEKRVSDVICEMGESIGNVAILLLSVVIMFVISLAMLMHLGGVK